MDDRLIGISLSPDIQSLLQDNELDIIAELQKRLPEISRPSADITAATQSTGTKSTELLILASAAAAPLVATAICQIIEAISRAARPRVIESEKELPPTLTRNYKLTFLGLTFQYDETRKD